MERCLLVKYTVNGEDSLELFNYSLGLDFNFKQSEDSPDNICLISWDEVNKQGFHNSIRWTWRLNMNDTRLEVISSDGPDNITGPFGGNKTPAWIILKLKENDIHLQTTFNGKEYYIELE